MPFPISLPTTSALPISSFLRCDSHPSLILATTTRRNVLRTVLKKQRRLPVSARPSNLPAVLSALSDYLPYILAIDAGLGGKSIGDEEADVILEREIEVEWRPSLGGSMPGRDARRVAGKGLDFEVCFVLTTLAYTHTLLARRQLHTLYAAATPSAEQRAAAVAAATKHLLHANSIHALVSARAASAAADTAAPPPAAKDIASEAQAGLAAVALAEATLLAVLKDDPYPALVIQGRNKDDNEWMYKAPSIPKVRAHLFARLAVQAAEHAATAYALLLGADEALAKYAGNLQRTARAKACRFLAIDAELGGNTGEGIAWLNGGLQELGFEVTDEGVKAKGFARLKKGWEARREDRKIEKGEEWGADAGRREEGRVIELLEGKWHKANDLINSQVIPPSDPLVSNMPSGRAMYSSKPFVLPVLDPGILARMRAPPDRSELARAEAGSDDSDDEEPGVAAPSAFPGSSASDTTYY